MSRHVPRAEHHCLLRTNHSPSRSQGDLSCSGPLPSTRPPMTEARSLTPGPLAPNAASIPSGARPGTSGPRTQTHSAARSPPCSIVVGAACCRSSLVPGSIASTRSVALPYCVSSAPSRCMPTLKTTHRPGSDGGFHGGVHQPIDLRLGHAEANDRRDRIHRVPPILIKADGGTDMGPTDVTIPAHHCHSSWRTCGVPKVAPFQQA